jgi:hypothetical protein
MTLHVLLQHGGDAVDLDVEMPWPSRHIDEDPRRRIFGKVARIDRVDRCELVDPGAVDVAFSTLSSDDPAVSTQSFSCSSTSSVWRSIGASTISPVAGSNGGNPET